MSGTGRGVGPEDERDLQAGEYVLGALPANQARALEALALTDPFVAASIAAWEDRLAPLSDIVAPVAPPAVLWRRLALASGLESVIQAPVVRRGVWRGAGLWRATTVGSLAVAASLAFLLYMRPLTGPEPLMAALSPINQPGATFLVRVGADGLATVVAVADTKIPAGRSLELWAVRPGAGSAPESLGLLPGSGRAQLTIRLPPGTQLLVSEEEAGGSPKKLPTTTPILAGQLTGI